MRVAQKEGFEKFKADQKAERQTAPELNPDGTLKQSSLVNISSEKPGDKPDLLSVLERFSRFQKILPDLLKAEGGFVDNPNDNGGPTMKGITLGTFQQSAKSILGVEAT
ncbi:MAG: hypothetical protein JNM63_17840, partial [Spirochaetia bacterium]|nr:hypothetical protein [Spirochaetia bacterium]